MLSISNPKKAGSGSGYYFKYYADHSEDAAKWVGKGVALLGLGNNVEGKEFNNMLEGYSPDGKSKLIQNAGRQNRQGFWDLTLSVPKSVSVLYMTASERVRDEIEKAVRAAAETTLNFNETVAGLSRRGKAGMNIEPAALAFATFFHLTSRAEEPQLHLHCLLPNIGIRQDGTTGALHSLEIFRNKMNSGALFQVQLAHELVQRFGVEIEQENTGFYIKGVPRELCDDCSKRLRLRGLNIGVITYTNAACDEIKRRLDFDPIIKVSTIHSFVWSMIQGFNNDIRSWLVASLNEEIGQLQKEQEKGKAGTKIAIERQRSMEAAAARLAYLPGIKRFVYSPTGENRTRDSLNHSEVIKIGAAFLTNKTLMQELLVTKFPILLIDESQDTNKLLIDALFLVQAKHRTRFCLGLFGDVMQRIYADGKKDLGQALPADWKSPSKVMNHRCPARVIKLINKIRSESDAQQQRARSDAPEGFARLFVVPSSNNDKQRVEALVRDRMAAITGDPKWQSPPDVKTLILEHHMAAKRLAFFEMFGPLYEIESFRTGLRDGSLSAVHFFAELVYPVVNATQSGKHFAAAAIVRRYSPLLAKNAFRQAGDDQMKQVRSAKDAVDSLIALFANGKEPSFLDVLKCVTKSTLFDIPDALKPFAVETVAATDVAEPENQPAEGLSKNLVAVSKFLNTRFSQIAGYASYVRGDSAFSTHQGVKGLEFPRVLVIMDDEDAGGFLFSYDKLFGVEKKTATDLKNEKEGKETGIDRTRRLFYVTCSRSKESLALVAYSHSPAGVRSQALAKGWFEQSEIEEIK